MSEGSTSSNQSVISSEQLNDFFEETYGLRLQDVRNSSDSESSSEGPGAGGGGRVDSDSESNSGISSLTSDISDISSSTSSNSGISSLTDNNIYGSEISSLTSDSGQTPPPQPFSLFSHANHFYPPQQTLAVNEWNQLIPTSGNHFYSQQQMLNFNTSNNPFSYGSQFF